MLSQVVELIEAKRRFAITSHIRPDGDSLGSSLGLYWLLRALDKDVEVIMRDPVPHAYQQLQAPMMYALHQLSILHITPFSLSSAQTSRAPVLGISRNSSSSTSITTQRPHSSATSTGSTQLRPQLVK